MKHIGKCLIALLMTMVMAVSTTAIAVSGAAIQTAPHYKGYTIFGDSLASGFAVKKEDGWDDNLVKAKTDYGYLTPLLNVPEGYYDAADIQALRELSGGQTYRVHNSYPDLVGNAIGIRQKDDSRASYQALEKNGFYNLSRPALRSVEVRMMVDPSYQGDSLSSTIWGYIEPEGVDAIRKKTVEYVKNSELITINIGSNDIAINCLMRALNVLHSLDDYDILQKEVTKLAAEGRIDEATAQVFHRAKVVGMFPAMATAYLYGFFTGAQLFTQNWDPIIEGIHKINPKAKIIAVGFNNPFSTYALTDFGDENWLRIGHLLDVALGMMDVHEKELASTRNYYTFVDAWDVEPMGLLPLIPGIVTWEYLDNMMTAVHPTNKGHEYTANQIIKELNGDKSVEELADITPNLSTDFYRVEVQSTEGGRVFSNMAVAREGDYIRLNIHPKKGYKLGQLKVIDSATGKDVRYQSYVENRYTCYMPKGNLEVMAEFVPE